MYVFENKEPYWNYKVTKIEFHDPSWNLAGIHEELLFSVYCDSEIFN